MTDQQFDSAVIAMLKRKIDRDLQPIKVMLVHRKSELSKEAWVNFVNVTHESILTHPDQFLEKDNSNQKMLQQVVDSIFDEFLRLEKY